MRRKNDLNFVNFFTFSVLQVVSSSILPTLQRHNHAVPSSLCSSPVGLAVDSGNTHITNFTLTATEGNASESRLNSPRAWYARNIGPQTYLQVELGSAVLVTAMQIQGDHERQMWIGSIRINYSINCQDYSSAQMNASDQVFAANVDANSISTVVLNNVFVARCIRLIPTERHGNRSALRFEILGCSPSTCSKSFTPTWTVSPDLGTMNVRLPGEKLLSIIRIEPRLSIINQLTISYSRTCTHYQDVLSGESTRRITTFLGESVDLDFSFRPLRALCLRVTSTTIGLLDSSDLRVTLRGCDVTDTTVPTRACGTSHFHNSRRQKRVVGGVHSFPGEWPWLVSLHFLRYYYFTNTSGLPHLCGGSLIHPQWVISAAHCFDDVVWPGLSNPNNWRVLIGEHNQAGEDGTEQVFRIGGIFKRDRFQISLVAPILEDIVLLKLDRPAVLTEYVNVICLDTLNQFNPGTMCITAGWGQNREDGKGVKLPLYAELPIIQPSTCRARYDALPDGDVMKTVVSVDESVLCAASDPHVGTDSCQGDSGGPYFCRHGNHWAQAGIVSIGYGCADSNFPGIYTRISYFINWINQTLRENSDDIENPDTINMGDNL